MKHVVGFSGGIDSQACARWVLNRFPKDDVILLNADAGGNEHPITTDFILRYSKSVHPVVMVSSIVADMGGLCKNEILKRGLTPNEPLTFNLLAQLKGCFPSRTKQFCTHILKLTPALRWIQENITDGDYIRYSGIRRQESQDRRMRMPSEHDSKFDCKLINPLVDWTKKMCFDYVEYHGEEVNPLYKLGFNRVGCAPCVNSNKSDILNWHRRFPEMLEKVRQWERDNSRTFFMPMVPGKKINWIDDVIEWSKTVTGGRQYGLHVLGEPSSCESKFGLCE